MLQIIALRKGAVFTDPMLLSPSFGQVMRNHQKLCSKLPDPERYNLFYTLAHHSGAETAEIPQRTAATFLYQEVVAFDIDDAETEKISLYANILAGILQIPAIAVTQISSGGGVHLIVNLKHPIRNVKYFSENKRFYNAVCDKINHEISLSGLTGKADPVIFEPARILRLPGTLNKKPSRGDKICHLVNLSEAVVDLDWNLCSGIPTETENVTPQEIRRNFPIPDFVKIYSDCKFIQHFSNNPEQIHEPEAFDLFSLMSQMPIAVKVTHQGSTKNAHDICQWVFDRATASKSLAKADFDTKFSSSGRYGCRKCEFIKERHPELCSSCEHYGKILTPLAIKSKEHLSSEKNGFWVLDKNGKHQYPNYSDLFKIYKRDKYYVVTEDERIFTYSDGIYTETRDIFVKSWLENQVEPSDPLRENHRKELVCKIKAAGTISKQDEERLFGKSLVEKINCMNGVLDVRSGLLLPHSPEYGFKYRLNYNYTPEESSQFFLDWLAESLQHEQELMETALDMMAYCLLHDYSDHCFLYISGEGGTGKSTFLNVVRSVLGRDNYSSVNIHDLVNNRFAPANLEGKLANISEESSGSELSSSALNILKTLSAGGELNIERKGEQGYSFKNNAKLLFSANVPPVFTEKGSAIQRRLIVIPFNRVIENKDCRIEQRLCNEEVPGILSILVRRIQDNIKQNGRFVVSRGGAPGEKAASEFLTKGNSAIEWGKESLVSDATFKEEDCVSTSEAYVHYKSWCEENGYKFPLPRKKFTGLIRSFVVTRCAEKDVQRVDGTPIRVFSRTKFKKEILCEEKK